MLSNDKDVTDRYNVIIGVSTTGQAQLEAEQRERVATLYDSLVDKYRDEAEQAYKDETATIKDELNQQYNNQKATLEAEYEATRDSLQARQKAYQSLTFNVTSLDEQALANKMDLLGSAGGRRRGRPGEGDPSCTTPVLRRGPPHH